MSNENIFTSEGLGEHEVPRQVMILASALSRIHGDVIIRREEHGIHLYMASPTALERDGSKELQSKHMTVNADRYFGLGQWRNRVGTYNKDTSAVCHKYGTKFTVTQLKGFPPLEKRGIKEASKKVYDNAVERDRKLIDDGKGNRIPPHAGLVMPIKDMPQDHAAVEYLINRGYSLDSLTTQFRCGFCYSETPESREAGRFYRRLPGGFKDTPQGRIVFYVDIWGVQEGWQARIIQKEEDDRRYFWHPYQNAWELVHIKVDGIWHLRPDWQREPYPWKPSKYRSADGIQRSKVVMGYDAAVAWNKQMGIKEPFAILVEGPLDAGRFGPPGIAFLGKYLNADQGALLGRGFKKVIFIADSDAAGRESKTSIIRSLSREVDLKEAVLPKGVKDVGEMDTSDAWGLVKPFIR